MGRVSLTPLDFGKEIERHDDVGVRIRMGGTIPCRLSSNLGPYERSFRLEKLLIRCDPADEDSI